MMLRLLSFSNMPFPTDVSSFLIWVIAGGLASALSVWFEKSEWSEGLSPTEKRGVMFLLSGLLTIGAVYLQQTLTPEQVAAMNPYVTALLALVPILANQFTHAYQQRKAVQSEPETRG